MGLVDPPEGEAVAVLNEAPKREDEQGLWLAMCLDPVGPGEGPDQDYFGWPLRDRLELLAFDARLAGVPQALLEALWEAIDHIDGPGDEADTRRRSGPAPRGVAGTLELPPPPELSEELREPGLRLLDLQDGVPPRSHSKSEPARA